MLIGYLRRAWPAVVLVLLLAPGSALFSAAAPGEPAAALRVALVAGVALAGLAQLVGLRALPSRAALPRARSRTAIDIQPLVRQSDPATGGRPRPRAPDSGRSARRRTGQVVLA